MQCPPWLFKILLRRYSPPLLEGAGVCEGLDELSRQYPDLPAGDESPVFIFSAGWRSGSTLLQRLLNSHPDLLVWGEAYENAQLLHHLAAPFAAFTKVPLDFLFPSDRADFDLSDDGFSRALTRSWTATLSPDPADLKRAHLTFLATLFKRYAASRGRSRWGVKMISGTEVLAEYLRWLYPECKMLYLLRSPYSSFRSYVNSTKGCAEPWYLQFPSYPVKGAAPFAVHWRRCVEGFVRSRERLGAFLIRYEDLANRSAVGPLQDYLGLSLDASVLDSAVDLPSRRGEGRGLLKRERAIIRLITGDAAAQFGYTAEEGRGTRRAA